MMADLRLQKSWSDIPQDLLIIIFELVSDLFDIQQYLSVCLSWRSAAKIVCLHLQNTPLLLLPCAHDSKQQKLFTSLNKNPNKLHTVSLLSPHHSQISYAIINSYREWLLLTDDCLFDDRYFKYKYSVYNPVTRESFQLPILDGERSSIADLPKYFFTSLPPTDPNCVVFLVYECSQILKVTFCKPKDKSWRSLTFELRRLTRSMVYYNSQIHGVYGDGALFVIDLGKPGIEHIVEHTRTTAPSGDYGYCYLVESTMGELLMTEEEFEQYYAEATPNYTFVRIFRLNKRDKRWEEVNSLGDDHQALFLAREFDSLIVSTSTEKCDYRPNCIYSLRPFCGTLHITLYDLGDYTTEHVHSVYSSYRDVQFCHWFKPVIEPKGYKTSEEVKRRLEQEEHLSSDIQTSEDDETSEDKELQRVMLSKISTGKKGKGKNKSFKRWRFMQDIQDLVGRAERRNKRGKKTKKLYNF